MKNNISFFVKNTFNLVFIIFSNNVDICGNIDIGL